MIIDYTKKRKSKTNPICPACHRKGRIRVDFLSTDYHHVVDAGGFLNHVKDYCTIENKPQRKYYDAVKEAFRPIPSLHTNIHYMKNGIESNFNKGDLFNVAVRRIAGEQIDKFGARIESLNKSIENLGRIITNNHY